MKGQVEYTSSPHHVNQALWYTLSMIPAALAPGEEEGGRRLKIPILDCIASSGQSDHLRDTGSER